MCAAWLLSLLDVFHSCSNNVTFTEAEIQAAHITRCNMLLPQTHVKSQRRRLHRERALKRTSVWQEAANKYSK